jgi:hypothetical protein
MRFVDGTPTFTALLAATGSFRDPDEPIPDSKIHFYTIFASTFASSKQPLPLYGFLSKMLNELLILSMRATSPYYLIYLDLKILKILPEG